MLIEESLEYLINKGVNRDPAISGLTNNRTETANIRVIVTSLPLTCSVTITLIPKSTLQQYHTSSQTIQAYKPGSKTFINNISTSLNQLHAQSSLNNSLPIL